jgi:hypothetical protein
MATSALLQSHDELRGILKLVRSELRKHSISRRNSPLMQKVDEVLNAAKTLAEKERKAERGRVRITLKA